MKRVVWDLGRDIERPLFYSSVYAPRAGANALILTARGAAAKVRGQPAHEVSREGGRCELLEQA